MAKHRYDRNLILERRRRPFGRFPDISTIVRHLVRSVIARGKIRIDEVEYFLSLTASNAARRAGYVQKDGDHLVPPKKGVEWVQSGRPLYE